MSPLVPSHEIRSAPSSGLRWTTGMAVAFTAFMVLLAVGCLLGLLTQDLPGAQSLSAAVIGAMAAYGATAGWRTARGLRSLQQPTVLARLDHDGVHLHEGLGATDLPDHLAWTVVPWGWISSVTHTTLGLASVKALGGDVPLEVLRFTLADDRLLDPGPFEVHHLGEAARLLGLTPTQTRTVLVGEAGRTEFAAALEWVRAAQPDTAILTGSVLPWSTRATPDGWPDSPRVAVVGAHGRLGRLLVEVLARREKAAPVALARNEAHRAELERLGAEVRMVDLDQGPLAVADALRGCAAVVHAAPTAAGVVVEAARRAKVERFLLVAGNDDVGPLATSGLAWTAFRPALLTDGRPTGEVSLGLDVTPGPVPRTDLAEVVAAAVRDEDSVGEVWPIAGATPSAPPISDR